MRPVRGGPGWPGASWLWAEGPSESQFLLGWQPSLSHSLSLGLPPSPSDTLPHPSLSSRLQPGGEVRLAPVSGVEEGRCLPRQTQALFDRPWRNPLFGPLFSLLLLCLLFPLRLLLLFLLLLPLPLCLPLLFLFLPLVLLLLLFLLLLLHLF